MQNLTISEWKTTDYPMHNHSNVSFDYFSFFTGVIVALIGFVLTIIWEKYKAKQQEENSLITIAHELETNGSTLDDNIKTIQNELLLIEKANKVFVKPLLRLNDNFSSFLIMNCPSLFKNQANLLEEVRRISRLTSEINEIIQSRENYRVNNRAMDNYVSSVKQYDEILQNSILRLDLLIPDFIKKMKAHLN